MPDFNDSRVTWQTARRLTTIGFTVLSERRKLGWGVASNSDLVYFSVSYALVMLVVYVSGM